MIERRDIDGDGPMSTTAVSRQTRDLTAVELAHVNKRYGTVAAIVDVNLSVAKGEFVTLLGPSGSGKTTLLNLLAGTISPSSGRICINGHDATAIPPSKRGIGMVFQNYALMPHMTVFDNIAFPLRVRKVPAIEICRKVQRVLELIQLPDVGNRKPRELSGGQQQRVSLARCVVYNPALILMDEPLGALDKKLRDQMQLEIKRLHSQLGITMLYVTHDQEEALTMSDRIVLMDRGRIEQIATPDELYFHPRSTFAAEFLGQSNLFDVRVREISSFVGLTSEFGPLRASLPPFAVAEGGSAVAMVRPENMSVLIEGEAPGVLNCIQAVAIDSIVLGGMVRHHLRLADGRTLIIAELNRTNRTRLIGGHNVRIVWRAEDTLLLR